MQHVSRWESRFGFFNRLADPEVRDKAEALLGPESGAAIADLLWWPIGRMFSCSRSQGYIERDLITQPVIVYGGTRDRATPYTRRTARLVNGESHRLQGRGHWLLGEEGWQEACASPHSPDPLTSPLPALLTPHRTWCTAGR